MCLRLSTTLTILFCFSIIGRNEQILLKSFLFALTQQQTLPETILFYNVGASVICEGSALLEALYTLEESGVEILTCGTCLNYYGLTGKLRDQYVRDRRKAVAGRSCAVALTDPFAGGITTP